MKRLTLCLLVLLSATVAFADLVNMRIYEHQGDTALMVRPIGVLEWLPSGTARITTGVLGGGGTNSNPLITTASGKNFLDFRTKCTDATGQDSRGLYWRHYAAGVNSSSDCFRPYLIVTASGANAARGIHSSVAFTGTGNCSGEVSAAKGTLEIPPAMGGTAAAVCANLYLTGTGSTVAGNCAGLRFALDGDSSALAIANTNSSVGVISLDGVTITDSGLVHTSTNGVTHGMRILINGAPYELLMKAL
jgi:hypothetical protein